MSVYAASLLAIAAFVPAAHSQDPEAANLEAPHDVAAAPATAETTESGLGSVVLEAGSGDAHPMETSWVRVHYTGWTTDGKMFDTSRKGSSSVSLPLDRVIQGWTEGLQLMVEGEQRRFWIPEDLAYGGREGRPQGMLVFDIELVEIVNPPDAPEHLTAPAPDAEKHRKGLTSKVLQAGTGTRKPTRGSTVAVHYSGWTTDGQLFDTTVIAGKPATFPLTGVIQGWTEGLQLMVEGEKRRFWIPEKLAYKGIEGKPQGMLIFDVELVTITMYDSSD